MQLFYSLITTLVLNFSVTNCAAPGGETTKAVEPVTVQDGKGIATFAGGCFWCTEAVFERVIGVKDVVSGYTGGPEENPTYRQVSYGETGHAEAVQIYYDPAKVTYQELLEIFFATHDPTQVNRQGPDVGAQYRTEVYYHNEGQQKATEAYIKKLNDSGKYGRKIATKVTAYEEFWLAEKYHQDYYELNPGNPYIKGVAVPKVKKFKKLFPEKVKSQYQTASR